ncbi:MAG TPA: hypothetical protein VF832_09040 [Longimicrobiales bacterium]
MRGGNRQRPRSEPGQRPPRPPRDVDAAEAALWRELAAAVAKLGTYKATDLVSFRRMVRCVYRAEVCPLDAAPSASGRLEQAAASALASFGLSPLSRQRVVVPKDERTVAERILEAARKGQRA